MATTKLSDVIVPERFTDYVQLATMEKSALIQSGAIVRSAQLDADLQNGGSTFNRPFWNDLANVEENISSDNDTVNSTAQKITSGSEVQVRLNRNQSWSTMNLSGELAGSDPMAAIGNRVASYWVRRQQALFINTLQGVFADNDATPIPATAHVKYDLTNDISGGATIAQSGISAGAMLDTVAKTGDAAGGLALIFLHSLVLVQLQKQNLIEFIPDSQGVVNIPTYMGKRVIVDDSLPNPTATGASQTATGVFHTWILGEGVVQLGSGTPDNATEVDRDPASGNGGGQETLYNRVTWALHPVGHAYRGIANPNNTVLSSAASWERVFPERKQIKIARLITKEF